MGAFAGAGTKIPYLTTDREVFWKRCSEVPLPFKIGLKSFSWKFQMTSKINKKML